MEKSWLTKKRESRESAVQDSKKKKEQEEAAQFAAEMEQEEESRPDIALDQSFVFQSPKFRFVISLKATQISRNFRFAFLSRAQNESKFFLNTQSCTNRSSSRT